MLLFGTIAFGIGVYSYRHLPLIDFLPYKIGTNLAEAVNATGEGEVETIVVYRDRETGKERAFELSDTTWYDDNKWEYVATRTTAVHPRVHPSVRDFALLDEGVAITDQVLEYPGVVYMVCASDLSDIKPRCASKLASAVSQAYDRDYIVMCLTAEPLGEHSWISLGGQQVRCFNMDASTMKTMLRAKVGVVVLRGGVIVDKGNCRDMLDKGELPAY